MKRIGDIKIQRPDGKENVKTTKGVMRKTTTLHVNLTFLYISLPYLHDYDLKMANFARFMENVKKQQRNLISVLKLRYVP